MIKQSYPLLSRIMFRKSNFKGLMRFQNVVYQKQKFKQCYGFSLFFKDQQVDNFHTVLAIESIKLKEEIAKMKNLTPADKELMFQIEIQKRLDEYQEKEINKDGSYSKDFAVNSISEGFQLILTMSAGHNENILITENFIPTRLINILQKMTQNSSLQNTFTILKILNESFTMYKYENIRSQNQLKQLIKYFNRQHQLKHLSPLKYEIIRITF